jgi:hypothetical protein
MLFKEMDEAKLLEIVNEYEDVLTPMVEADQAIYDSQICPRCGGSMYVKPEINRLLANNRPIPKHLVKCAACDCVVDPFSGIMVELGNLGNLEPAVPLIHRDD